MNKLILTVLVVLALVGSARAQVLNLNTPETLAVPTATKLDLRNVSIDVTNKTIIVTYRFLAADNTPIAKTGGGHVDRIWTCQDTCFDDTFSFVIRTQDAGTPIGKGLRQLLWNKMRSSVLTGGNNATLP